MPTRAQPGRLRAARIALLVVGCAGVVACSAAPPTPRTPRTPPGSVPPDAQPFSLPPDDILPTELPPTPPPPPRATPPEGVWQRIEVSPPVAGGGAVANILTDVIATNDGLLLASGVGGDAAQVPIVLSSGDGVTWTPEAISSAIGGSPSTLGLVGGRVIAVGGAETGRCAHPFAIDFWARNAAATWTEAPWDDRFCAGIADGAMLDDHGTAVFAGMGSGDVPLVWGSTDGLDWRDRRPTLGDFFPSTAAVVGAELVLFGMDAAPGLSVRTSRAGGPFVRAPAPQVPASAEPLAALVRGGDILLFLTDGPALGLARRDANGAWSVEAARGIVGDEVTRIEDVGGTLVALGTTDSGRSVAWTSADGASWAELVLPLDAAADVAGAAAIGRSLVLVGSSQSSDGTRTTGTIWVGRSVLAP